MALHVKQLIPSILGTAAHTLHRPAHCLLRPTLFGYQRSQVRDMSGLISMNGPLLFGKLKDLATEASNKIASNEDLFAQSIADHPPFSMGSILLTKLIDTLYTMSAIHDMSTDKLYRIKVCCAGSKQEHVHINIKGNKLTVKAEFLIRNVYPCRVTREIEQTLPDGVDLAKLEYRFDDYEDLILSFPKT